MRDPDYLYVLGGMLENGLEAFKEEKLIVCKKDADFAHTVASFS
jgi:hypothetical protein